MEHASSLTITRTLNTVPERLWRACSQANGLRFWWGQPEWATMPFIELDFRVGGSLFFRVEVPTGEIIWGKAFYKEIVPPDPSNPSAQAKIVMEDHYSNEKGELLDSPEWPASMITLTIEDSDDGAKLKVLQEKMGDGGPTIEQYKEGWKQSLDRLALELVN